MPVSLTFYGGARTATGANYLLETQNAKILVDCGLEQGGEFEKGRFKKTFLYDPSLIDAVVITHAHIDHTGLLPKLAAEGFSGPIFMTPPSKDLAELLLKDSAHVMKEEASDRGERPLYSTSDVEPAIKKISTLSYHERKEIAPGVFATLFNAGHTLGSAIALLEAEGISIAFSGDLGNSPDPILPDVEKIKNADYVVVESTYGDRVHEDRDKRRIILREEIIRTVQSSGVLLIPTFAFGRTQEILDEIYDLTRENKIPKAPIFLDSPLAIKLTEVFKKYRDYYNEKTRGEFLSGRSPFDFPQLSVALSVEESKHINSVFPPKIIIASSGMLTGGRILHHAIRYLPDSNSTLLITGWQAAGSLGRRLLNHARQVRIFGDRVSVKARVKAIGGYSAHADQPALLNWLSAFTPKPKKVFMVQGETASIFALRDAASEELGLSSEAPLPGEKAILS